MSDCASGLSVPPTRYSISLFDMRSAESLYQGPAATRADLLTQTLSSNQTIGTRTVANAPPLEIGVFEVECTAEIPTPTRLRLQTTLFSKINGGEANGVSKDPMKRRRKIHHVPPIYIHRERFVRCFNLITPLSQKLTN